MKTKSNLTESLSARVLLAFLVVTSCSKSSTERPRENDVTRQSSTGAPGHTEGVTPESAPRDLSTIKAASIQIVDGERVSFRGLSGVSSSMNPGMAAPELPCIWVIRSLSERNRKAAAASGVTPGNAYVQLREGNGFTTLGVFPVGKRLWHFRAIDPTLSAEQLFAEFAAVMTRTPWKDVKVPDTARELIASLGDEDKVVRSKATEKLATMNDPQMVDLLVDVLKDGKGESWVYASELLKEKKDPRVVELLIPLLKAPERNTRFYAIFTLREMADSKATAPLLPFEPLIPLLKDGDYTIRRETIKALGRTKDVRAVEPLIALLKDDDLYVRGEAAEALGAIGDSGAVEPLLGVLKDVSPEVIANAVDALGEIRDPRALKPIMALREHRDSRVSGAARSAVEKLRRPKGK